VFFRLWCTLMAITWGCFLNMLNVDICLNLRKFNCELFILSIVLSTVGDRLEHRNSLVTLDGFPVNILWLVFFFFFFEIAFLCLALAVLNSLCRSGWPQTQRSACLCLLSCGPPLLSFIFFIYKIKGFQSPLLWD
jgi:hypothetical protein